MPPRSAKLGPPTRVWGTRSARTPVRGGPRALGHQRTPAGSPVPLPTPSHPLGHGTVRKSRPDPSPLRPGLFNRADPPLRSAKNAVESLSVGPLLKNGERAGPLGRPSIPYSNRRRAHSQRWPQDCAACRAVHASERGLNRRARHRPTAQLAVDRLTAACSAPAVSHETTTSTTKLSGIVTIPG